MAETSTQLEIVVKSSFLLCIGFVLVSALEVSRRCAI